MENDNDGFHPVGEQAEAREAEDGREARTKQQRESSHQADSTSNTHAVRWEQMFTRLQDFKKKKGHCRVPNRYKEDPSLGAWVSAQRRQYKIVTSGQSGSTAMTLERAKKLVDIGFEWSTSNPNHVSWETRYEELKAFVKTHGHAQVPMRWQENEQLSNWVSKQRQDYKLLQSGQSSRLNDERLKLLQDVGFVWEVDRATSRQLKGAVLKANEPSGREDLFASSFGTGRPIAFVGGAHFGTTNDEMDTRKKAQHTDESVPGLEDVSKAPPSEPTASMRGVGVTQPAEPGAVAKTEASLPRSAGSKDAVPIAEVKPQPNGFRHGEKQRDCRATTAALISAASRSVAVLKEGTLPMKREGDKMSTCGSHAVQEGMTMEESRQGELTQKGTASEDTVETAAVSEGIQGSKISGASRKKNGTSGFWRSSKRRKKQTDG